MGISFSNCTPGRNAYRGAGTAMHGGMGGGLDAGMFAGVPPRRPDRASLRSFEVETGEDSCGSLSGCESGGECPRGGLAYVGFPRGEFVQQMVTKYVGVGGDWTVSRSRQNPIVCLLPIGLLLLLVPLGLFMCVGPGWNMMFPTLFDCEMGALGMHLDWSQAKQEYCCSKYGKGCQATVEGTQQPVIAIISDDRRTAMVRFTHNGEDIVYHMLAESIYMPGGFIRMYKVGGPENVDPGETRTFFCRESGKWAAARLHEDGSVSGMFQHNGALLKVRPHSGEDLVLPSVPANDIKPGLEVMEGGHLLIEEPLGSLTSVGYAASGEPTMLDPNWGGDRWYGGSQCYQGDDVLHNFVVGIAGDYPAYQRFGSSLRGVLETAVAEASMVYENQLHIKLIVGTMQIVTNPAASPAWGSGCEGSNGMGSARTKLYQMRTDQSIPFEGAYHLFTGCTNAEALGWAFEDTICQQPDNIGVDVLGNQAFNEWRIYAHELGHNFGAAHSFEEGQGTTGGLMDYGDGTYNGVAQFNSKYRKAEMCTTINNRIQTGICGNKFYRAGTVPNGFTGGTTGGTMQQQMSQMSPAMRLLIFAILLCLIITLVCICIQCCCR